jgi:hypothetical protein
MWLDDSSACSLQPSTTNLAAALEIAPLRGRNPGRASPLPGEIPYIKMPISLLSQGSPIEVDSWGQTVCPQPMQHSSWDSTSLWITGIACKSTTSQVGVTDAFYKGDPGSSIEILFFLIANASHCADWSCQSLSPRWKIPTPKNNSTWPWNCPAPMLNVAWGLREPPKDSPSHSKLYMKEKCLVSLCLWSQKRVDKQPWLQAPLERVGAREARKLSHLSDDQLENSRSPAPREIGHSFAQTARYWKTERHREVNMGQKSCHLPNPIMNGHLSTI